MGSSSSKPSSTVPHSWTGSAQTGVSQNLIETLESNNETDVSRTQALELEIQRRVAAELKRLREQEADAAYQVQQQLSAQPSDDSQPGRQEVVKVIDDLRTKLGERRKVQSLPDGVEAARNEVVRCLRENDRRPLDCWREVEAFKEEVRRLEKGWVDKVVS